MQTQTLDNGLRVVVQPRAVPLVAIYLWLEVGSADERPDEHGAAHFLEHMLFKGTPTRAVGEVPAAIEGLGGDLNAYTSLESTVLHATVEAAGWTAALEVIADMALQSLIDPDETEREREVILEEVRSYASDPEEMLYERVQGATFPAHAYARPILGTAQEVRTLSRDAVVGFWKREWGAGRAVLSIAGQVDAEAAMARVRDLFGQWEPGPERRPADDPPAPAGPHTLEVAGGQRQTRQVQLVWRAPPRGHPDQPALELLALALGDGPGGLLPERLAEHGITVADPQGASAAMRAAGTLTLTFVPDKTAVADQLSRMLGTLRQVLADGIDEEIVGRVRAGILADHVFEAETVDGIAWNNAHFWSEYGSPHAAAEVLRATASLTASDVSDAARRWLIPDNLVVGLLEPSPSRRAAPAVRVGLRAPVRDPFTAVDHTIDGGPRLLVQPDDGGVVGISIQMRGGRLREPARYAGLGAAWSQMVTAGADGLSAGKLSAALDRTGGEVWGSSGRSSIALNARFPADTAMEGLALTLAALAAPEHDPQAWERVQDELMHDAESADDYAGWVAEHALWGALWPRHPWARRSTGTPATIGRLSTKQVRRFHDAHLASDNVVVAITGRLPSSRTVELVEEWCNDWPARAAPAPLPDRPGPRRDRTVKRTAPAEQAHLAIGVRGLGITDPDTPVAQVLSAMLGAQGGRLFLDLREERGLAYSVWAEHAQSLGGGLFEVGLATDPARLDEARAALNGSIAELLADPPSSDEVQRTIRMLRGGRAASIQRASYRASRLASAGLFGLPLDLETRVQQWQAVTPQAVFELAVTLLQGQPRIEVHVTPADPE